MIGGGGAKIELLCFVVGKAVKELYFYLCEMCCVLQSELVGPAESGDPS